MSTELSSELEKSQRMQTVMAEGYTDGRASAVEWIFSSSDEPTWRDIFSLRKDVSWNHDADEFLEERTARSEANTSLTEEVMLSAIYKVNFVVGACVFVENQLEAARKRESRGQRKSGSAPRGEIK